MKYYFKKIVFALALILILAPLPVLAENQIEVVIDGEAIDFTTFPFNQNGTLLVEFRPIFEKMGIEVTWDSMSQTVKGFKEGLRIQLQVGNSEAEVNGVSQQLAVPPTIVNGRTLVPLRFVGEASGYKVNWDAQKQMVTIDSSKSVSQGSSSANNESQPTTVEKPSTSQPKPGVIELDLTKNEYLRYEGEQQDGKWHGQGKLYDIDGTLWYEGEFKHNKRDGYGKLYWPHGELQYEGEWKDDQFHGYGTMYSLLDGEITHQGEWKNSTPVK